MIELIIIIIIQEASADSVFAAMLGGVVITVVFSLFSKIGSKRRMKKQQKDILSFRSRIESMGIIGLNDKINGIYYHLSELRPDLELLSMKDNQISAFSKKPSFMSIDMIINNLEQKINLFIIIGRKPKKISFDINTPLESIIGSINLNN
jgi:hypothetical protein